jgi:hypothetical protein
MADNTRFQESTDPAQPRILDKEVTHSGDLAKLQYIGLGITTGTEGAYTFRELAALDTLLQSLLTLQAAATSTNAASGTADAQMIAATPSLRLVGFTAKENAGSPALAEFILRNGTSTAGTPVAHVKLGAGESVRDWFGPGGISVAAGVYLDRISGTTDVTIHTVVAA